MIIRKFLYRIENLLLILPFVLLFIHRLIGGNTVLDIHLHDTYIVINDLPVFFISFWAIFIPYLLHFILRSNNKWTNGFSKFHVYSTVFIIVLIFILSYLFLNRGTQSHQLRSYYEYSSWSASYNFLSLVIALLCCFYILIQLSFIVFFIVQVTRKPNRNI